MPSTYTLNNGIELIGTGEQSGTWGDTTNTNLELLDTALDGQVTITLVSAGTSGSPNDLPISDGTASNGRNRMVIFNDGGDLGATAYVQLTPNDAEKIIYVRNDLSGSRSIILFQGTYNASNDYELPAGTTAVIYFDGAGSGAVAANVFNNAYFDSLRLGSVSVTEIIDDDTMATAAATNIATSESIKAYVDAQVGANNELSEVLANGNTTGGTDISVSSGDDITFADSSKAIFGAGSDLQIYHDGVNSFVKDTGTGNLFIQGEGTVAIQDTGGVSMALFNDNADVQLRYASTTRLATTSTGVDITGTLTSDGLTVDGSVSIQNDAASFSISNAAVDRYQRFRRNASNSLILDRYNGSTTSNTAKFDENGDITFYDTSGNASFVYDESAGSTFNENGDNKDFRVESDSNANMLFVDASANAIGINSSNPDSGRYLHIEGGGTGIGITLKDTGSPGTQYGIYSEGSSLYFENDSNSSYPLIILNSGDLRTLGDNSTAQALQFRTGGTAAGRKVIKSLSRTDSGSTNPMVQMDMLGYGSNGYLGQMNMHMTNSDVYNSAQIDVFSIYSTTGAIFNDDGVSYADFRVESDTNTHALFVDAGASTVSINKSSASADLDVGGSIIVDNTQAISVDTTLAAGSMSMGQNNDGGGWGLVGLGWKGGSAGQTASFGYSGETMYFGLGDGTNSGSLISLLQMSRSDGEIVFNNSNIDIDFRVESNANASALKVDANADSGQGVVLFGQNVANAASNGAYVSLASNNCHLVVTNTQTTNALAVQYINRQGSDGTLMEFRQANSAEGSISVSGSTVSYNGFSGRHESSGIPTTTARGTVVSTIDELDEYLSGPKQGQTRADHAKVEVSDSVGDPCVYGVVDDYTDDGSVNVISVGIAAVRVTGACAKGDLLESNGDGTAKVQSDDIVRSKTLGKVTIGNSDTGVKLVSCVMYCG